MAAECGESRRRERAPFLQPVEIALDWQSTKRLMRLRATAQELVSAARNPRNTHSVQQAYAVVERVHAVAEEIRKVLRQAGDEEAEREFTAVLGDGQAASEAETLASVLVGWLEGAIEAETYEMKVKAEAEAYAKERVRTERTVGFGSET